MAVNKKTKHPPHRKRPSGTKIEGIFDRPEIIAKLKLALTQGEILYLLERLEADQRRVSLEAQRDCVERFWSITFRVLNDRFDFDGEKLNRFWEDVLDYSRSVNDPRDPLTVRDIVESLKSENDFEIDWTGA